MLEFDSSSAGSLNPAGSRFGFHNGSSIDSLLDKEDVSLETILDEDDLLQECKAQNTRLIDYFQRLDVLQRLLDNTLRHRAGVTTILRTARVFALRPKSMHDETDVPSGAAFPRILHPLRLAAEIRRI